MSLLQAAVSPAKASIGLFGGAGSGKTLTSALIGIGLSKMFHAHAPIAMFDTEDASSFVRPVCEIEGVPLVVARSRSFIDMRDALSEAESAGCCTFIVDSYSDPHRELHEALRERLGLNGRRLQFQHRDELTTLWNDWTRRMRISPLHCLLVGKLAFNYDEVDDEAGDPRLVKLGTKMRGDADAGYEPNLLIELEAIQDSKRDPKSRSKRGSHLHYAHIVKDRTMVLNGRTFSWKDLNDYKAGDYLKVFHAVLPHLERLGLAAGRAPLLPSERATASRSSVSLFQPQTGESAFSERSRRATIALEEIHGAVNAIWPGSTNDEKRLRAIVLKTLFGSRSEKAIESLPAEMLEQSWTIMRHFEADQDGVDMRSEAQVIALIASCRELERQRVDDMVT